VKTLQAVIGGTRKLEAELKSTQAELQQMMTAEGSKEAAWEEARQRLEAELERRALELEAANAARSHVEASLEAAHDELLQLSRSQADAAETWERARQELQQEISDLQAAAGDAARTDSASVELAKSEIDQARRAADQAISAAAQMQRDARDLKAEADSLRAEVQARTETLEALRAEHAKLAANYRGLEGKLSEARERVRQLTDESGTARAAPPAVADSAVAAAEQRRELTKIEQVGKLGAAMAPEIETLVSSIDQAAATLVKQLEPANPQRAAIEAILKSSTRATSLVRQLATFSRKQAKPIVRVDLNEVVKRAEPSLARLLGGEIDLKLSLGQAPPLTAGEDDVEQILTAMTFSAREALTLGGTVVLSTASDGSRAQLTATAFGYGVQPAKSSTALDGVLRRCAGDVTISGDADRDSIIQVSLPLA
jgi:chromosome segregation ATPase